jgi:surface polysaccharide O-acyltransferase-like enzyme
MIKKIKTQRSDFSRIVGLDLLRSCAILFVISVHFFTTHTPFNNSLFEGGSLFLQAMGYFFFGMGVPLFLLLTGYLNTKKMVSFKYYKGGIRVLISYVLFSIITILFRKYYLDETDSWLQWGNKILGFSAIPYAWYIEMWIGLFLLVPFLNILYKNIPSQKQKLLFIGTLYIMTALPDLLNRYGMHFVPGSWKQCYPLTFYFIGSYIHEYKPDINKKIAWLSILGMCLINPVFNCLFVKDHTLIRIVGDPFGVFGTILAVLFFLIMYRWDCKSNRIRRIVGKISLLSLDMYLCCYIFDALFYPYFKVHYFVNQSQFGIYFFIIVPIIFCCSYILAWLKSKALKI